MKIALGADHAGFELKEKIKEYLLKKGGIEVIDKGIIVKKVYPNSPASKYGLKNNDVILELNGKKVNSAGTFIGELAAKRIGETVNLKVYSNGKEKNINVTLEKFK